MTRVLLVEDDEMNRDMLLRRLERKGFVVETAVNGAEAVDMATNGSFDVVLMDMSLPILDGYQATQKLRGIDAMHALPIIGLSAHAMVGDREKAIQAGCDDYDTKPVDLPRLLSKISALLAT